MKDPLTGTPWTGYLNYLSEHIHKGNVERGWCTNLETGKIKKRNVGNMLMLIVTEISEAMEGHRKDLMDDKLPHRKMFEVELADAMIRIFDLSGEHSLDLAGAIFEKLEYNAKREDHKLAVRKLVGGKKY